MERDDDRPGCPPWCTTSAAEHAEDDPGTRLHEGPRFGLLRTWWEEGPGEHSAFTATVAEPELGAELGSDDLRLLAADALDAALWIDRQARTAAAAGGESVVELVKRAHAASSSRSA